MAAGVPVIAANRTAFPEVMGKAAPLVDPADSKGIAALVRDLINDDGMRADHVVRGRKRADTFRWPACAARVSHAMQSYDRGEPIG
jgi:alpha-1,3-rhamnosyl/mannosyltransferase